MLQRSFTRAAARIRASQIGAARAVLLSVPQRAASRATAASAGVATPTTSAAATPSPAASSAPSLPQLPPTQLTYLTGAALTAKEKTPLQAVALFLTEEDLQQTLAAARASSAGDKDAKDSAERALTLDALLASAGGGLEAGGLLTDAVTYAPSSSVWNDFRAKSGETLWLYPTASAASKKGATARTYPRVLLIGLGAATSVTMATYRTVTWKAVSACQQASLLQRVGIVLPMPPVQTKFFDSHLSAEIITTVSRIAQISNHHFRRHLSAESIEKRKKGSIEEIALIDLAPLSSSTSSAPVATRTVARGRRTASASTAAAALNSLARPEDRAALVKTQSAVAQATLLAREWANERGDIVTPAFMEAQARIIAKERGLSITVLQDADLQKEGLEMIRAVGRAGLHKARLVVLEYKGADASKSTTAASKEKPSAEGDAAPLANITALVGKGVTFDTGGLLIKGRGNMEGMHLDMSGSSAVLAVMQALPQIGYRGHVVGVLALAENAISAEAYKPLSILPSVRGSVEVIDTDAEGRLVLADAFTFVQRKFKPARMVDLATLTGAAVVALGEGRAALFANELEQPAMGAMGSSHGAPSSGESLVTQLYSSGERVGERLWRMPIDDSHRDELKGTHSDWRNTGATRMGGSCTAAAFLEKFVDKGVEWAHIDLAGPAMRSKAHEWSCEGGTGFGTQLLVS
jgi:leucyl aminopeptidase